MTTVSHIKMQLMLQEQHIHMHTFSHIHYNIVETFGQATESAKKQVAPSATLVLHKRGLKCVLCPLSVFTYLSALFDLLTVSTPRTELITSYVTHSQAFLLPFPLNYNQLKTVE